MERRASLETKRAMFWAALAEESADEPMTSANRVAAALLRMDSVKAFLIRAQLDAARVLEAVDAPGSLPFDECERRVLSELARKGLELGSVEHRAAFRPRRLVPVVGEAVDSVFNPYDDRPVSALELLLALIRADVALAERLAPHGVSVTQLRVEI